MDEDRARASDYNDPMSSRLLGIAADVLRSFGSAFGGRHLAIVGGVVPSLLAPETPPGMTRARQDSLSVFPSRLTSRMHAPAR
jgi:hypothetical protein